VETAIGAALADGLGATTASEVGRAGRRADRRWPVASAAALGLGVVHVLLQRPVALTAQPYPDGIEYLTAARNLALGNGYRVQAPGFPTAPRYPPGFPAALALGARIGHYPGNVEGASLVISALLLVVAWAAARRIAGDRAACLTAVLMGVSPFAAATGRVVMSDTFAAVLTGGAVFALAGPKTLRRSVVVGVLLGYSVLVRLGNIVFLGPLWFTRRRWQLLLAAAPVLAGLVVFQWVVYHHPTTGGYVIRQERFAVSSITAAHPWQDLPWYARDGIRRPFAQPGGQVARLPNLVAYPALLLGYPWVFAPPLTLVAGVVELWRRRRSELGRLAAGLVVGNLVLYLPFFAQCARYMAPAATVLCIFAGVGLSRLLDRRKAAGGAPVS